jgi:integrase
LQYGDGVIGMIALRVHAILLLLATLGVRAREVVALDLDDIDRSTGKIAIRGKDGKSAQLPLADDAGAALAAYLRHDRPRSATRSVFIRHRAPLIQVRHSRRSIRFSPRPNASLEGAPFVAGLLPISLEGTTLAAMARRRGEHRLNA